MRIAACIVLGAIGVGCLMALRHEIQGAAAKALISAAAFLVAGVTVVMVNGLRKKRG